MQTVTVRSTSRRHALGQRAGAGTLGAGAVSPSAALSTEDPHPRRAREADEFNASFGDVPEDDEDGRDRVFRRIWRRHDLVGGTPASTLEGVRLQVELALRCHEEGSTLGDAEERARRNAIATLERLATGKA
jgi:hypothetical protein